MVPEASTVSTYRMRVPLDILEAFIVGPKLARLNLIYVFAPEHRSRATLLPKFAFGARDDVLASSVTTTCAPATTENATTANIRSITILANRINTSTFEIGAEDKEERPKRLVGPDMVRPDPIPHPLLSPLYTNRKARANWIKNHKFFAAMVLGPAILFSTELRERESEFLTFDQIR